MSRLIARALLLLALLAVAACGDSDPGCARLPGGGRYCLQPTTLSEPFEVQQRVDISFNGQRETMIVELEVDADGMRFAGLTPFGHKLVQAHYDNLQVTADVVPDKRLDPVLLFAFLQIALWPADSVRGGLDGALRLDDGVSNRQVFKDGRLVVDVSYTGMRPPYGNMRIDFPLAGMEIEVTTLDGQATK
ncbi:MAG: DUF3261 domain-containing protein [Betaproteobacteria bacterium]